MDPLITLMSLDLFLAAMEKVENGTRKMFEREPKIGEELVERVNSYGNEMLQLVGDFIEHNEAYRSQPFKPILTKENMLLFINADVREMLNYIAAEDGELTPEELAFIKTIIGFRYSEEGIFEDAEELDREMLKEDGDRGSLIISQLGYYDPEAAERYIELLKKIGSIMTEFISPKSVSDPLLHLSFYWNHQYHKARMEYLEMLEIQNEIELLRLESELEDEEDGRDDVENIEKEK